MTNGGVLGTNAPLRQFHIGSHFMWIMWLHGDKNHSHMTSGCEQSKFLKAFDTPSSYKSGWINGKNVWNSRWLHSSAIKTTHWQAKQCEIMFLFPFCLLFLFTTFLHFTNVCLAHRWYMARCPKYICFKNQKQWVYTHI